MSLIRSFFLSLLLFTSLFSKDLTELYLSGDEEALTKAFEEQLITKEYWENKLQNRHYKFGYYQNEKTILIACKRCNRFKHFLIDDMTITKLNDFNATFGKVDGDKYIEGDLKTPVGVYAFIEKLKGEKLDQYYGPVAFVTDYPNTFDKSQNKNGHGIWLHGYPLNGNRDDIRTKGCIALENNCLEVIEDSINYKDALLIVNETKETMSSKEEIVNILVELFKWRRAWRESDFESYISFYSEEFKRYDGINLQRFRDVKRRIFKKNSFVEIFFKNLEITPYPNSLDKRVFRIKFNEKYRSNLLSFDGEKEIFVEIFGDKFKILVEK